MLQAIERMNHAAFLALDAPDGTPSWLVDSAAAIADLVIYIIPVLLLALWLRGNQMTRNAALKALLVSALALAVNQAIIRIWPMPRPSEIGLGHTWIAHASDPSFPSDHATVFAAVGLTLLLSGLRRTGFLVLAGGVMVAWARVFLGVHFPLDMIGAGGTALLAYVIAAPCWRLLGAWMTHMCELVYHTLLARPIARGWLRP